MISSMMKEKESEIVEKQNVKPRVDWPISKSGINTSGGFITKGGKSDTPVTR